MNPIRSAALVAALLIATPALAQVSPDARFAATTLNITGHGEARVPPDRATIVLGVTTDAATAGAAMQANAADMSRVVAALRAAGIPGADIQTSMLAVSPQYAFKEGAPPRLTGYQATNEVTVTTGDLARIGQLVDAAASAGATNVGQVSFGLKNRGSAANFARLAAVKDLDDKAQIFADAAGYHIRRLVNLSEAAATVDAQARFGGIMTAADRANFAPTPVESGQITLSVDVTGEFELTH